MKRLILQITVLLFFTSHLVAQLKPKKHSTQTTTKLTSPVQSSFIKPLIHFNKTLQNRSASEAIKPNPLFIDYQSTSPKVTYKNKSIWIEGPNRQNPNIRSQKPLQEVFSYIQVVQPQLNPHHVPFDWKIKNITIDETGHHHILLNQWYKNYKIYGAEIKLHGEYDISLLQGHPYQNPVTKNAILKVNLQEAIEIMQKDLPFYTKDWEALLGMSDHQRQQSEIVWYPYNQDLFLTYHITIHNTLTDRWEYFIDGQSGKIIHKYKSICRLHNHKTNSNDFDGAATSNAADLYNITRTLNTYEANGTYHLIDVTRDMYDASSSLLPDNPVGTIWTIDAIHTSPENDDFEIRHVFSTDNTWDGSASGISAHYNAGLAYDYFKNTFGRESINGQGGNIISLVNVANPDGSSLQNAFWNGIAIFYGNGGDAFLPLARGLDVAIHEMSHGVIQSSANLEYQGESGAINESLADVFAVLGDRDDYLLGEDVVKLSAFPSGALRDMMDPANGAAPNDYNNGYQPKLYSQRYIGSEDNGGVHINSGIPNHAFYLIASNIGKDKAEQIYYRALTTYLLKSSQFVDLRLSLIQAAIDLYGSGPETQAIASAFDAVEVYDGTPTDDTEDYEPNPGESYLLVSDAAQSAFLIDREFNQIPPNDPISNTGLISKPSVTDDGRFAVFIGSDNKMYSINFQFDENGQYISHQERVLQDDAVWRNVVVSRDGQRLAGLFENLSNSIWIYDFNTETAQTYELFNPTYSQGVTTGDVQYADAMEFDFSGQKLMYDAFNVIPSTFGDDIEYWDIGFLEVWNNERDSWGLGGIEKLFANLPEGVSVGNPTFSKNSDYIVAFDLFEDNIFNLMGANIESGQINTLFTNNEGAHYPNFSIKDNQVIHDLPFLGSIDLGILDVDNTKINTIPESERILFTTARWGVWLGSGTRDLTSSVEDLSGNSIETSLYPNPVSDQLTVDIELPHSDELLISIIGTDGVIYNQKTIKASQGNNKFYFDLNGMTAGMYLFRIKSHHISGGKLFFKE